MENSKTVREYLNEEWEENSGHITKKAILQNASNKLGSYETYSDIEGLYMAVYSYWEHNIQDMTISENQKWVGYELRLIDSQNVRLIVPQWVMNIKAKSEFHAKNLFTKYLKVL